MSVPQDIQPMIDTVEATQHTHVVVFISDSGVHMRPETKEACEVMARIINQNTSAHPVYGTISEAKVIEREEFLKGLRKIISEESR